MGNIKRCFGIILAEDYNNLSMKNFNTTPLIFVLFFIQNVSTAQNTGMLFQNQEPVTFEKVYLHTDREFYFLGETIWFREDYSKSSFDL